MRPLGSESVSYDETRINKYLQAEYLKDNEKLKVIDGYRARLITKDEIINILGGTYKTSDGENSDSYTLDTCPIWKFDSNDSFEMLTMSETNRVYESNNCIKNYDDENYTNSSCAGIYVGHERYYTFSKQNNKCIIGSIGNSGDGNYYPVINYLKES